MYGVILLYIWGPSYKRAVIFRYLGTSHVFRYVSILWGLSLKCFSACCETLYIDLTILTQPLVRMQA